jgi:hypothetical protein
MTLKEAPDEIRMLLQGPLYAHRHSRYSVVESLVQIYGSADEAGRSRFAKIIEEVLEAGRGVDAGEECLARALQVICQAEIRSLIPSLQGLASERAFCALSGEYPDLHGRLLETLYSLGALDVQEAWRTEQQFRDFAPLVFSFLRETAGWELADLLPDVARLGFLSEALAGVSAQYGPEYVIALVRRSIAQGATSKDASYAASMLVAIDNLTIAPIDKLRLSREIRPELSLRSRVLSMLNRDVTRRLQALLAGVGVQVEHSSSLTIDDRFQGSMLVAEGTALARDSHPFEVAQRRGMSVLAFFDEGDQISLPFDYSQHSGTTFTVPSHAITDPADYICNRVIEYLPFSSRVEPDHPPILAPSPARIERLSGILAALPQGE